MPGAKPEPKPKPKPEPNPKPNPHQMGFINVLVKPLYSEFCGLLGEPAQTTCLAALQSNLDGWEQHGNGLLKQMEVSFLGKGIVGPRASNRSPFQPSPASSMRRSPSKS